LVLVHLFVKVPRPGDGEVDPFDLS